jgi:hypothetical protein
MNLTRRILLAISLSLFGLTIAFWIRSFWSVDLVSWGSARGKYYEIVTIPGHLRFTIAHGWPVDEPLRWIRGTIPPQVVEFGRQLVVHRAFPPGIALISDSRTVFPPDPARPGTFARATVWYELLAVPFPVPVFLTLLYPAWLVLRRRYILNRRAARSASGLCPRCGYDLRSTPGRCPECGYADEPAQV